MNAFKSDELTFSGKKSFDHPHSIAIADTNLTCSKSLIALGVTFDRSLKWGNFLSKIVSSCNLRLRALYHPRSTVGPKLWAIVARAVALSKFHYWNSLLRGASVANIDSLQKVQNMLARVATGSPRRTNITPVLASLHWLPVRQRIIYKLASIT